MRRTLTTITLIAAALTSLPLLAQDVNPDRVTVSWSDPSKPGLLKVRLIQGGITVKTHSGPDVIIEAKSSGRNNARPAPTGGVGGLRRIDSNTTGLRVEEANNVMTVGTSSLSRRCCSNIEIQVPTKTNLNLSALNGGDIIVDGVEGELEVTNMNGGVELDNVAGSVVAHSLNGGVTVSLRQVSSDKAMSFTSMNGNVDVTLPANTKANLKMRTDLGEIYSDFEVKLMPNNTQPTVEDTRRRGGRYRIELNKNTTGTINGGGPDFGLRTLNGNIFIRKGK